MFICGEAVVYIDTWSIYFLWNCGYSAEILERVNIFAVMNRNRDISGYFIEETRDGTSVPPALCGVALRDAPSAVGGLYVGSCFGHSSTFVHSSAELEWKPQERGRSSQQSWSHSPPLLRFPSRLPLPYLTLFYSALSFYQENLFLSKLSFRFACIAALFEWIAIKNSCCPKDNSCFHILKRD